MSDEKFDQSELDKILKKIDEDIGENKTIDDLFASADGKPLKKWTMENIDKLIDGIEKNSDYERASEEFDFDKYEDDVDSMPEPAVKIEGIDNDIHSKDDLFNDMSDVYFSKDAEPVHRNTVEDVPMVFEDISSNSDNTKKKFVLNIDYSADSDTEESVQEFKQKEKTLPSDEMKDDVISFFEEAVRSDGKITGSGVSREDMALVEADEKELKRQREEFRELDEKQLKKIEDRSGEEFNRGDFIKVKDIFKKSKILSRRRQQRSDAKSEAMDNIREKYGDDVFSPQKSKMSSSDYEKLLKEDEDEKVLPENVRFDMEKGEHFSKKPQEPGLEKTKTVSDLKDEVRLSTSNAIDEKEMRTKHFGAQETQNEIKKTDIGDFNNLFEDGRDEVDKNQLTMEGFSEGESVEHVSEQQVENDLIFSSNERKKRFHLTNIPEDYDDTDSTYFSAEKGKYDDEQTIRLSDEDDTQNVSDALKSIFRIKKIKYLEEYTSKNEIPQVFKDLKDKSKSFVLSFLTLFALEIFAWILTSYPIAQQFTGSVAVASVINILVTVVLLVLAFYSCSQITQSGLKKLFSGHPDSSSMASAALVCTLIYSFVSFFNLNEVNVTIPIFTPIVIFILILFCVGEYIKQRTIIGNFKVLTKVGSGVLKSIEKIENNDDAQILARSYAGENPKVMYSCSAGFPGRFLFNSTANHPADKFIRTRLLFLFVLSIIISIVSAIVNKSAVALFATMTSCICICVPVSLILSNNISLRIVNRSLNKKNSCITGNNAIHDALKANAVIISASELFDMDKCNFHGMHEYGTIKVDDIVTYAAAMLTKSRGPLSHVFDKVIIGDSSNYLPEVENLLYEERLGLSGWIQGQKILVGNRNLLIHHGLEAPAKSDELAVAKGSKKVLYVAVDNHVAALLVVSYEPNEDIKKYLQNLNNNNKKIIVSTNDCNIDEDMLSLEFSIPRESFKIIGDFDGGISSEYTDVYKKIVSAKLIHDEVPLSYICCMSNAVSLASTKKLINFAQTIIMLLGLLVVLILSCAGNIMALGSGTVIIYHVVSTILLCSGVYVKYKFL